MVLWLIGIGLVAGLIAGISPCILPVLPVVLAGGATTPDGAVRGRTARAIAVVGGLVLSFSLVVLFGAEVLGHLGLPKDLLNDVGLVLLGLIGLGLLVPPLGRLVERPFIALGRRQPRATGGGFLLGLSLGPVFVPCAGPVLAALTTIAAKHMVGWSGLVLMVAFAVGIAVPLLIVALAGEQLVRRVRSLRAHAPIVRQLSGVVLIAMSFIIGFNVTQGLQNATPGYTNALQNRFETGATVTNQLNAVKHEKAQRCKAEVSHLESCGAAPAFFGISSWLNTPGDRPLKLSDLVGKVVLVDFWTYSCINCQRSLPHVEAWYARYHRDGFEIVGVHTPEFPFEYVRTNVISAAHSLGVHYPIALDNNYATWTAYKNSYWPAEYLIDAKGDLRHISYGEGGYGTTESLIRQLLSATHPRILLPPRTDVANTAPTNPRITPESYLGYNQLDNADEVGSLYANQPGVYRYPTPLPTDYLGFAGTWAIHAESAVAGRNASLALHFQANHVYLVLGGHGTIGATVNGVTRHIVVSGIPRLYTMFNSRSFTDATLVLRLSPGVAAYDFTFG